MTGSNQTGRIQRPPESEFHFAKDLLNVLAGHGNCAGLALLNVHRNNSKNNPDATRVEAVCGTCRRIVSTHCGSGTTCLGSGISVSLSDVLLRMRDGGPSQQKRNDGS
jgi:hypothetical protein